MDIRSFPSAIVAITTCLGLAAPAAAGVTEVTTLGSGSDGDIEWVKTGSGPFRGYSTCCLE